MSRLGKVWAILLREMWGGVWKARSFLEQCISYLERLEKKSIQSKHSVTLHNFGEQKFQLTPTTFCIPVFKSWVKVQKMNKCIHANIISSSVQVLSRQERR